MLLAEAAQVSENLRNLYRNYMTDAENRSTHFRESVDIIRQAVRNAEEDLNQLIEIFYPEYSRYPRQFVSFRELRDDVCKKLSISPLVWDEALAGKPMVPLLALESPEYGGNGLTIKQAMNLMARIKDEGFLEIAGKLNEKEALLFWSRATGERPPMPMNRFIQLVSYIKEGFAQSLKSVNIMLQTMNPSEIIQRIMATEKDLEIRTMQPGQPFVGPVYKAWDKLTTPADVYAEVITYPRQYLHITEFPKGTFKGVLYNKHKQIMGKPMQLPYTKTEAILEVEVEGPIIKSVTDVLAIGEDWNIYKLPYKDRVSQLQELHFTVPTKTGMFIPVSTDFNHYLQSLEQGQRLRLTSAGPIELGGTGGWTILKDAFHLHLLVTAIKRNEEYQTQVRVSAMDGYETYEVGQLTLSQTIAQHSRQRLAQQGVLVGQDWIPVDEYALVIVVEMKEFSLNNLSLTDGEVKYLDDTLGYGNVSQLTDMIEMSD